MTSAFPFNVGLDDFSWDITGFTPLIQRQAAWGTTFIDTAAAATGFQHPAASGEASYNNTGILTRASNWWNGGSWNDSSGYIVLSQWTPASQTIGVCARTSGVNSTAFSFYALIIGNAGATDLQLARYVAGTKTMIGSNVATTTAAGDAIGIACVGSTITGWHRPGNAGEWVLKQTAVDATIGGGGVLGVYAGLVPNGTTIAFTEFGGGPLPSPMFPTSPTRRAFQSA